tara:strand:+ start:559 stop:1575 length:1017 start_codon:yes stop_codon:yes gene_type:complete
MCNIINNFSLKEYNTFKINVNAKYYTKFSSTDELKKILTNKIFKKEKHFILGGGSNILLTQNINSIVLHNNIKGISVIKEDSKHVIVEVGAGVIWHDFVVWSVSKNLSGIENLALIPGSVGASPMQNIGAYGVEVKDTIYKVNAIEIKKQTVRIFSNHDCKFQYRSSIFKNKLKNKYIITKVIFKLSKEHLNITTYGDVEKELIKSNLSANPKNISTVITRIRNKKLPNPKKLANCGSFFKNPIISIKKFRKLKEKFPNIIGYENSKNEVKVAAGWLIENAGLKGYKDGDAGVHKNQALVLVNYGNATGRDILNLARYIQEKIKKMYGICIDNEVNIL